MDDNMQRGANVGGSYWSIGRGDSPVVGTAIHDGHEIRSELSPLMALSDSDRLREEDPFTADMISGLKNQVVVHRSRFEIDLNRAREQAVYLKPEQAWGLEVWRQQLDEAMLEQSLSFHDEYYAMLAQMLQSIEKRHGAFVVLDIHSYNHRRKGAGAPATPQAEAPDINIGTISMDRDRWSDVLDLVVHHFQNIRIHGRPLDVRENVAFQGKGEQTRFIHERFSKNGCAIAIEFKKFFMDEWTGEPDSVAIRQLRDAVTSLETVLTDSLRGRR